MLRLLARERGQSTAEYAIVIALVLGALVGMQTYVRRALNARIADSADTRLPNVNTNITGADPGGNANFPAMFDKFNRANGQYEPYYASSDSDSTSTANTDYNVAGAKGTVSGVTGSGTSASRRSGSSTETGFRN